MSLFDRIILIAAIWACVYPGVLIFSYAFEWLDIEWPIYVRIAISTACTVPLISLVIIPRIEAAIADARNKSPSELKMEQARESSGPDPEEVG